MQVLITMDGGLFSLTAKIAVCWFLLVFPTRAGAQLQREANSSIRMPLIPKDNLSGISYSTVKLFDLTFDKPVAIRSAPGETNRLYIVERSGRIMTVTNMASPVKSLFLDISGRVSSDYDTKYLEGLSSMAFHPGYRTNRFFYVTYTLETNSSQGIGNHNRLARFERSTQNYSVALPGSEMALLTQKDEGDGHNWNDLHFGPDGNLYVALGDEGDGGKGDDFNNSQKIDNDFFGGMIRIDVDKRATNKVPNLHPASARNYLIPADNPFIGLTNFNGKPVDADKIRTEFFAIGLRNPWRFSFDSLTGTIYVGDVGQHGREEINIIVNGGNYGWAFREGSLTGPKGAVPAGVEVRAPLLEYGTGFGPFQGFSVIGGVVYRGSRMPELYGFYIFADYVSGNIWATKYEDGTNSRPIRLTHNPGIAGFGIDPRNGDVLMVDHEEGAIYRLEGTMQNGLSNLPQMLDETGIFADLTTLQPQPGIVPYSLNVPFWSDHAIKTRWFSIPRLEDKIGNTNQEKWEIPEGTVWVKHFELELRRGDPRSKRRLETRVLVKNSEGGYGVTYRWKNATEAELVRSGGMDEEIEVLEHGQTLKQVWRYPSRAECMACHTSVGGFALGFNTAQLNKDHKFGNFTRNQIKAYSDAGYFSQPSPDPASLPRLAAPDDLSATREARVRSYLESNCVQCHQPGGTGRGHWDARHSLSLAQSGLIEGTLLTSSDPRFRVVKPGQPELSMLLKRIKEPGAQHMPPLGTSVLDLAAIQLMEEWIALDLTNSTLDMENFSRWQLQYFGSQSSPESQAASDPDNDGLINHQEFLLGKNPNAADGWKPDISRTADSVRISYEQTAGVGFFIEFADSLLSPEWKSLSVPPRFLNYSAASITNWVDDRSLSGERYYRFRILPP